MPKPRTKTVFQCQQCGAESPKWMGKCPSCDQWNTMVETVVTAVSQAAQRATLAPGAGAPQELSAVSTVNAPRIALASGEFNRVLGGGIVPGSLVLIGGGPGIGKSTLLLQTAAILAASGRILYVSGEESALQLKLRAQRLNVEGRNLLVLSETDLETVMAHMEQIRPRLVIIDSIQTVFLQDLGSAAGSVGQVRECTLRLMRWAKDTGIPVLIAGHVTKDGAIAGPRVLEHMVDVVLYLEGESFSAFRVLRGVKNRFGSTNEVGVFEMTDKGLEDVNDPSRAFLGERSEGAPGSAVVPTMEGSRPLLLEVQALVSPTVFSPPRRTGNGIDFNRLLVVTAVLSRRLGLSLSTQDIMVNVVGGLKVSEPAVDLAMALAIASSMRDTPVRPGLVAAGEVGLSGELRSVGQMQRRIAEAENLGFRVFLAPKQALARFKGKGQIELAGVSTLSEAIRYALPSRQRVPSARAAGEDVDSADLQ